MMQMLGGGKGADEKEKQMRDYLLFHMRMASIWIGSARRWAIEQHKPFLDVHGAAWMAG